MLIRPECEQDHAAIASVTAVAFAGAKHSDGTEPQIIERLRGTGALTVSLVAIDDGVLVGHVAFSPVTVDGMPGGWFGLGPVSVRPDRQGAGIGSALIEGGLAQLRLRHASGCVVLGDPAYYRRFGFERDDALSYRGAPPGYFLRTQLRGGDAPTGQVDYAPAFYG